MGFFALPVMHQGWQGLGMGSTRVKSAQNPKQDRPEIAHVEIMQL
jgi:hypothetical protein